MTEVRTFRAATMQEALDLVRDELGRDAVILHTRQVTKRRLLPWRKPPEVVEVTAGIGMNVRRPKGLEDRADAVSSNKSGAPLRAARSTPPVRPNGAAANVQDSGISLEKTKAGSIARPPESGRPAGLPATKKAAQQPAAPERAACAAGSAARHSVQGPLSESAGPAASTELDSEAVVAKKLDAIHAMLAELGRVGLRGRPEDIPSELFALYTELIDADVEDDVARDLVFRLKQAAAPEQIADAKAARALLTGVVQSQLRCAEPITPVSGRRRVAALVGSTGVGKTTTIAKLAAGFRLRNGIKMGLVTVDTYRIAAVEQLRTYAQIIDLPMKVVTSPPEMRRALDELAGLDLVLIDTAGRSPRDDLQIQELKSLLAEAAVDDVFLVMSMTSSLRSLLATAEKFQAAGPTSLILTKLDEAAGLGSILTLTRKVSLPIGYVTTGQDVPDDIEPANPSRLARLILGQDKLL